MKVSLVIISKNEPALADTLDAVEDLTHGLVDEVVVIDASERRLDWIRVEHPWVVWHDFERPRDVRVTIPHQRNFGVACASGDVIVFIDCGCIPRPDWLGRLLAPLVEEGEMITCGPALSQGRSVYSGAKWWGNVTDRYVPAAPTINIAFRREAFDAVNGFDESFAAGEDMDFTWRLNDAGYKLRWVPDAMVEHEWGDTRRQMRRSFVYGVAWVRLFRKHPQRLKPALREYPVPIVYPLFLLGLPLTVKFRAYPLLLLLPLWRARHEDAPLLVLLDHLVQGTGVIAEVVGLSK
jgi:cellulose synthase/poly-beta-1,6-N-acetylglucosamine synthase-like glycosyltransferase